MRRFVKLSDCAPHKSGDRCKLTIHADGAQPLPLEMTAQQVEAVTIQLLQLSIVMGQQKGVGQGLSANDPVNVWPVQAPNVAVTLGGPGQVNMVFPVGCWNLAMAVPTGSLRKLAEDLARLASQMESEPRTPQ